MESRWSSPKFQALLPDQPYQIVEVENDSVAVQMTIAGKLKANKPTELVAILMGQLKSAAEAALGENVADAVITVPAGFGMEPEQHLVLPPPEAGSIRSPQYGALRAAAALAGLSVRRTIREPMAVAMGYSVDRSYGETKTVVLDVGGEKLQVSTWEIDDCVFDMQSVVTLPVGGGHFNERLAEQQAVTIPPYLGPFPVRTDRFLTMSCLSSLLKKFSRKNGIPAAAITVDSLGELCDEVELAKQRLSTNMVTRIEISNSKSPSNLTSQSPEPSSRNSTRTCSSRHSTLSRHRFVRPDQVERNT